MVIGRSDEARRRALFPSLFMEHLPDPLLRAMLRSTIGRAFELAGLIWICAGAIMAAGCAGSPVTKPQPETSLSGWVVDSTGAPVESAAVRVFYDFHYERPSASFYYARGDVRLAVPFIPDSILAWGRDSLVDIGPAPPPGSLFQAEPVGEGIELRWRFSDDLQVVGVRPERAESASGPWLAAVVEVHDESGVTVALDRNVQAGQTYFYRLVVTTAGSDVLIFGPLSVTAGTLGTLAAAAGKASPRVFEVGWKHVIEWRLAPGVTALGFKIYNEELLFDFPTKINEGLIPPMAETYVDSSGPAVPYWLGVVLPGREVQYRLPAVRRGGLVDVVSLAARESLSIRAFPSIAEDHVVYEFAVASARPVRIALLYQDRIIPLVDGALGAGLHALYVDVRSRMLPSGLFRFRRFHSEYIGEATCFMNGGLDAVTDARGFFRVARFAFGDELDARDAQDDSLGHASVAQILAVEVSRPGYTNERQTLHLAPGSRRELRFTLRSEPTLGAAPTAHVAGRHRD